MNLYPAGNPNNLPSTAPERNLVATLESSPNTYLSYPAFGKIVIHEFDCCGNPLSVGFQQYQDNGTYGPVVALGRARECSWELGFTVGAKVAVSYKTRQQILHPNSVEAWS